MTPGAGRAGGRRRPSRPAQFVLAEHTGEEAIVPFGATIHGKPVEVTAVLERTVTYFELPHERWDEAHIAPLLEVLVDPAAVSWRAKDSGRTWIGRKRSEADEADGSLPPGAGDHISQAGASADKQPAPVEGRKKVCGRCKVPKLRSEFGPHGRTADGLQAWCNDCRTDWGKSHARKAGAEPVEAEETHLEIPIGSPDPEPLPGRPGPPAGLPIDASGFGRRDEAPGAEELHVMDAAALVELAARSRTTGAVLVATTAAPEPRVVLLSEPGPEDVAELADFAERLQQQVAGWEARLERLDAAARDLAPAVKAGLRLLEALGVRPLGD